MNVNLTPFLVLGALLVLSVVVMIVWRQAVARREDDTLHVSHGSSAVSQQVDVAHRLDAIDKWGKTLTVVTVVYCLIVGALFVYQQWLRASNLGL
jgi:hypothetical protein